ncbi:YhjD/YihY/BrkB family envelope integrity protein [Sulfurimonas sp.]|uniref:YhjD/YihY/BrkB family envelope integrity protein n=1 Tax=Sulfurimonas sp. TaxID=2022749 RepID=UPI0035660A91
MFALVKKFYNIVLDKELSLHAASLSFYTIFSIVPLLLILMSIVSYSDLFLQIYKEIQNLIVSNFLPVNHELIMSYLDKFLEHSLEMSLFSFVLLLISSLLFFQNYEYVVNNIFEAKQRSFLETLCIYVLIIIITPLSLGATFYISVYLAGAIESHSLTSGIDILPLIPYVIILLLFFILFKLSANVKVSFKAAALSSLAVTTVFSIAKNMFIYYVFINHSYNTLYGSFSILMFLFLWVYISWFIYLQGLNFCNYINKRDL